LRKLVKLDYVKKLESGRYQLTAKGKEYANSINEQFRWVEKQPKISILMVIERSGEDGEKVYLVQKRSRNPFFGYWSEVHGRAEWGVPFEMTAKKQLNRQTGLDAEFVVHSFQRVRDFDSVNEKLLEDKLFVILRAKKISGELTNTYSGGKNAWLTLDELRNKAKVFKSTVSIIENLDDTRFFEAKSNAYSLEDY
jgi:ADP-ribose pyrophosphatase YjhB (NUDIX family)